MSDEQVLAELYKKFPLDYFMEASNMSLKLSVINKKERMKNSSNL